MLEQRLRPRQFRPLFFFVQHRPVFIADAADRVEGSRMDDFAQDAGIEQAEIVNPRDAVGQSLNEPQQPLQLILGEHIVDHDRLVGTADAINAAVSLHEADRVPRQVVVDGDPAVLEVLALGQHVGADQDVDLVLRCHVLSVGDGGELPQYRPTFIGVVAAVDATDRWLTAAS